MQQHKRFRLAAGLLLAILLTGLLTGCGHRQVPRLYTVGKAPDALTAEVLKELPEYQPVFRDESINAFSEIKDGNLLECYDVQAQSAVARGIELHWQPLRQAVVQFAVNPRQVAAIPRSWQDLPDCDAEVSWIYQNATEKQLLLGAAAYGLTGEKLDHDAALALMITLRNEEHFSANRREAPVQIILSTQAIQPEKDWVRVTPESGTLAYDLGIASPEPMPELSAMKVQTVVPGASKVTDLERFLRETEDVGAEIRRSVLHTRLYTSANYREMVILHLLSVILALIWTGTVVHRAVRRQIRLLMAGIGVQTVLWLLLSLFKQQLPVLCAAARYCWYGYYLFQLGLPLMLLWLTFLLDATEEQLRMPRTMWAFCAAGLVLLLLVLTNDLHQLVFSFGPSGIWPEDYSYGPVYDLIYGFCFFTFFLAVGRLIWKSFRSPQRWRWIFPALSAGLLVLYTLSYALQWTFARESNYAMTFCTLAVLFSEAALHTGLIPVNTQYRKIFTASPLAMQLLNEKGEVVLAGLTASDLPRGLRLRLCKKAAVSVSWRDHNLLIGRAVRGGTLVWEEDRSTLYELQREMRETTRRLEAANALLRQEDQIRRKKLESAARAALFSSLEQELSERTEELSEAIEKLPEAFDRRRQIAELTLLLCYIKRRCNLFFLARENPEMPSEELAMYLDELCEFARYAGVSALFRCSLNDGLAVQLAAICYDFCHAILSWSAKTSRTSVLGELYRRDGVLAVRLLTSDRPGKAVVSDAFRAHIRELGGSLELRELDEETGIYLMLPEGGGPRD